MSAKTIRKALGTLQDDPDHAQAWSELAEAVGFKGVTGPLAAAADVGMPDDELARLLEAARRAHQTSGEFDAVARILEMEVSLSHGTARRASLEGELARVLNEEVLDDVGAVAAYRRLLEMRPGIPPPKKPSSRARPGRRAGPTSSRATCTRRRELRTRRSRARS
jgi:hypothetical protein